MRMRFREEAEQKIRQTRTRFNKKKQWEQTWALSDRYGYAKTKYRACGRRIETERIKIVRNSNFA